jgi:hypothetical protein
MAALALIVALVAITLGVTLRLERVSIGSLERLAAQRALADQLRADVARAVDAPERWQDDEAGPDCLILRLGKDHYVVYRRESKRLVRLVFDGETTHGGPLSLGADPVVVEFDRSRVGEKLLTCRLFAPGKHGEKYPLAEITAALGGDLQ